MSRIAFRNFTGGEVTPTLSARYDLQKFGTFLQSCENFIPNLHGDIERRPGTRFLASLDGPAVLVPFQFNTEPENNYVLIFMSGKILVADENGLVSGASLDSPYAISDVYDLSYHQVADVVYLAHKKYALRKLTRSGSAPNYQWGLSEVALNQSLEAPGAPTARWHRGPKSSDSNEAYTQNENYVLNYVVTAVNDDGIESLASEVAGVTGRYPTDWVQGDYVDLQWPVVSGAKEYNIYRESAGYYGFIGVSSSLKEIAGSSFVSSVNMNGLSFVPGPGVTAKLENEKVTINTGGSQHSWYCASSRQAIVWCASSDNSIWVLVNGVASADLSGIYDSFVQDTNFLGSYQWGSNSSYPSGPNRGYACVPVWSSLPDRMVGCFQDQNYEPDTSTTPKEDWNPFENGNHPAAVTVHQQRLVLAGTRDNPASFYMSRTGDYENFRKSRPLQDDDPVEYMLASGSIDDIKWLASFGELLIGTSGAEYKATSSGASITPSDVQISTESYWGSAGLQPMIIGNSVMHCQRAGSHVRDLYYSWENDGYAGNDLSLLAPQLVETHGIRQWAFQQSPGSNIWCVRNDGVLLCLTYMQEQKVYAWSRHVTAGKVLSVAALCGDEEDVVMLVVERDGAYFLERMARRFRDSDGIADAFFVDCGKTVTLEEAGTTVTGLEHLEGMEVAVLADGSPEEGHVVRNGKIELYYPAQKVQAGLGYTSVLSPMPVETDTDGGSTLGKRRAYGKVVLRVYRSVGGSYAASSTGDIFDTQSWQGRDFYDLPFLPDVLGEAVQPYSGDIVVTLPAGQDEDTLIWIKQDRPQPFRLVAISADIDFGEV